MFTVFVFSKLDNHNYSSVLLFPPITLGNGKAFHSLTRGEGEKCKPASRQKNKRQIPGVQAAVLALLLGKA